MDKLVTKIISWWGDIGRNRAYKRDAEYRRIEDLRHTNTTGGTVRFLDDELTMDHWEHQWEVADSYTPFVKALDKLKVLKSNYWFNPRAMYRFRIVFPLQRAKRGYSERDIWGFDDYLARVISQGIRQLANETHGHPVEISFEEWKDILHKIAEGFEAHLQLMELSASDQEEIAKLAEKRDEAFSLLQKWFGHLWD